MKAEYPKNKNNRFTWRVMRTKGKKTVEVAKSGRGMSWANKHGAERALSDFLKAPIKL